ncbi:hypothetical protein ACFXO9_31625 [Nocardia tengchongensis]|uniref:hypothetical protein n=1 Tax=Nocardia tengchongensis TaxID=2055889 RepID=UPI0036B92976
MLYETCARAEELLQINMAKSRHRKGEPSALFQAVTAGDARTHQPDRSGCRSPPVI